MHEVAGLITAKNIADWQAYLLFYRFGERSAPRQLVATTAAAAGSHAETARPVALELNLERPKGQSASREWHRQGR